MRVYTHNYCFYAEKFTYYTIYLTIFIKAPSLYNILFVCLSFKYIDLK